MDVTFDNHFLHRNDRRIDKEFMMKNGNPLRRLHPLVAGAAVSVMLVSLTGVAAITGLIPNSHGTTAPTPVADSIGAAAAASSPAAMVEAKNDEPTPSVANPAAPASASTPAAIAPVNVPAHQAAPAHRVAVCRTCGVIESVHAVRQVQKPSGVGVVAGALVGGLLGNQVGGGNGRALATVAGAVGGGYAGNEVEKRTHTTTTYQVRVHLENGRSRVFAYQQQPGWNVGDHVRVVNGRLTARG
jgi:outer membrane lipoprotein SlyB